MNAATKTAVTETTSKPLHQAIAGLLLVLLWSSGFVGAELGARQSSAVTLLFWRFALSSAVLAVLCAVVRPHIARGEIGYQAAIGALSQLFYVLPIYLGVQLGVPGGTTSLIAALQPLVVAAVAGPLLGERVGRGQAIGLVLGLVGVAVVVSADLAGSAGGGWAYLLPIAATLSLSAGTVLGRRRPAASALASLTIHTAVTALGMLIIAGIAGDLQPPMTTGFWLAVGWCGGLSGLGAYGAYLFVLRQQGATAVSSWLYLTPPTTVLWIWLMFGQPVTAVTVLGLLITAVGVVLAIRRRRARPTVLCGAALCGTPAQPKRPVM